MGERSSPTPIDDQRSEGSLEGDAEERPPADALDPTDRHEGILGEGVETAEAINTPRRPGDDQGLEDPLWGGTEPLLWRWVVLGLGVMVGLHALLVFGVLPMLPAGASGLRIGLGVIPYFLGGMLLGLLSRERSLLHPFYAALPSATVFAFLVEILRVRTDMVGNMGQIMAEVRWLTVLAPLLGYVLMALFATWIGEKIHWRRSTSI